MLDVGNEAELSLAEWQAVPSRAALPCSWAEYVGREAGDRIRADSRRRYARAPMCGIGVLSVGSIQHAVFTKDISRMGVGFYSPVNLFPRTLVELRLSGGRRLRLSVVRCRRLAQKCYEIGALFELGVRRASARRPGL